MDQKKRVHFTKSHNGYNPGEEAGFENSEAEKLITLGVAVDAEQYAADAAAAAEAESAESSSSGRRRRSSSSEE
jgi:hypothetical protein